MLRREEQRQSTMGKTGESGLSKRKNLAEEEERRGTRKGGSKSEQ